MFPPLSEIRVLRRRLGLTQQQLAKSTGTSQSLIAKVEQGKAFPAYPTAVGIFDFLEEKGKKGELKASDVMSRRVVLVNPSSTLKDAVRKFKAHDISQMPVVEEGHVVGVVSESDVLSAMVEGRHALSVRQVMEQAPPTVPPTAEFKTILSLLQYCPMVAVLDRGRLIGVISRADLIGRLYEK
jgi:predicted transcriptional regulator